MSIPTLQGSSDPACESPGPARRHRTVSQSHRPPLRISAVPTSHLTITSFLPLVSFQSGPRFPIANLVKSPSFLLNVAPVPSVAAYSSWITGMPKRFRNSSLTSGRIPLPHAMWTLCCLSSGDGGAFRRYRQSSPTYWMMLALPARTSGQNVLCENFRLRITVQPAWMDGVRHRPCAAPW